MSSAAPATDAPTFAHRQYLPGDAVLAVTYTDDGLITIMAENPRGHVLLSLDIQAGSDFVGRLREEIANAKKVATAEVGHGLTDREFEVLGHIAAGRSNKEVARKLGTSVRTVETHRLNLRRKTKTGRLSDLVTLARDLGAGVS